MKTLDKIITGVDRVSILAKITLEMSKTDDMVKFMELDKKFWDTTKIFDLEDEINDL